MKNVLSSGLVIMLLFKYASAQDFAYSNYNVFSSQNKVYVTCTIKGGNTCNGISLYRSEDSIHFHLIDQIAGTCGSTDYDIKYTFTDWNPIKNKRSWYKLYLGNVGYTPALWVEFYDVSSGYLLRSLPGFGHQIRFRNENRNVFRLNLYDSAGRLMQTFSSSNDYFDIGTMYPVQICFFEVFNTQGSERFYGKLIP